MKRMNRPARRKDRRAGALARIERRIKALQNEKLPPEVTAKDRDIWLARMKEERAILLNRTGS